MMPNISVVALLAHHFFSAIIPSSLGFSSKTSSNVDPFTVLSFICPLSPLSLTSSSFTSDLCSSNSSIHQWPLLLISPGMMVAVSFWLQSVPVHLWFYSSSLPELFCECLLWLHLQVHLVLCFVIFSFSIEREILLNLVEVATEVVAVAEEEAVTGDNSA